MFKLLHVVNPKEAFMVLQTLRKLKRLFLAGFLVLVVAGGILSACNQDVGEGPQLKPTQEEDDNNPKDSD